MYIPVKTLILSIVLTLSFAIEASADPIGPLSTNDTIQFTQRNGEDPGHGSKKPGVPLYAIASVSDSRMQICFSVPVTCEIRVMDLNGQTVFTTGLRNEDSAIIDISRMHGRFQLIIIADPWYAIKAYWFP